MTLATLGFEIVEAGTGEQALELVRTGRCDVVLPDIDMPGMGGIETTGNFDEGTLAFRS